MARRAWVASFEKPKTAPTALEPDTTGLSPYMKFGCVSARRFWHALDAAVAGAKGPCSKPPVSLHGQLLWREARSEAPFFYGRR
jgi:cryptochrome